MRAGADCAAELLALRRSPEARRLAGAVRCSRRISDAQGTQLVDQPVRSRAALPITVTSMCSPGGSVDRTGARRGTRYAHRVIRSFVHRGLRRAHERGDFSRLNPAHAQRIATILSDLHSARAAADLALPRYRLHPLKGDQAGAWSVRVSRTWRIVFRIEDGDVYDVDLVDYH